MDKKEEKKGFWASLFAPKSCCCCGPQIEEIKEDLNNTKRQESEDSESNKSDSTCCR